MKHKVFLDDQLFPFEFYPQNSDEFFIVRSVMELAEYLADYFLAYKSLPELISLDHNLTKKHDLETEMNNDEYFGYGKYELDDTGFHAAVMIDKFARENRLLPCKINIHSDSKIGRKNIQKIFSKATIIERVENLTTKSN